MHKHISLPQPLLPAPRTQTLEPRSPPQMSETHPLGWQEDLGCVTPQIPRPVVPSLREAEATGNCSDVDVDQQLLGKLAGGSSLPDVSFPDDSLPDVPLPVAHLDGSVGKKWTSPLVAEKAMVITLGLGLGSCLVRFLCSNLFFSGIEYYMRREVFVLLGVYFIDSIMGHRACSIVATPGMSGTSVWWNWGSRNLSS